MNQPNLIGGMLCGLLMGLAIGVPLGAVFLRASVSLANRILGAGKSRSGMPEPEDDGTSLLTGGFR